MMTRLVRIQLTVLVIASLIAIAAMAFGYIRVQNFLGVGRLSVTMELPATGGLYRFSNVTYRGVQIGKVTDIELEKRGNTRSVIASLSLDTSPNIPADVVAHVRSASAIGEQYVDLVPRSDHPPYLQDGSVIGGDNTTIPQPIGPIMDRLSTLVATIPKDQLHTMLDELHKGFKGSDYDLQSLLDSTATLSGKLNMVAEQSRSLIHDSAPLLDGQVQSDDSIRTWTRAMAGFSDQLVNNDPQIREVLQTGPAAADEAARLLNQLNPTLPVLLANLTTVGQLAVTYHPSLEQILVLAPPVVSIIQAAQPNRNAQGLGLGSYRVTLSDPPACTVGFLPPSSWRPTYDTTTIDTPDDLYCKLPQDSPIAVRGSRNFPCMTKPGKRAPTAEICDSDQEFEPLAQKQPVIGPYPRDPNLEAQGVPPDSRWFPDQGLYNVPGQGPPAPEVPPAVAPPTTMAVPPPPPGADLPPAGPEQAPGPPPTTTDTAPATPPAAGGAAPASNTSTSTTGPIVAVAQYDPHNGQYISPDGHVYRQTNLAASSQTRTWKDLVLTP